MCPSSARTTWSIVISAAGRASRYPPCAPRVASTIPAFLSRAAIRSRYARGSDSASAMALSESGCLPPERPSCTSSRTPYSAFVVKIMRALILPTRSEFAGWRRDAPSE